MYTHYIYNFRKGKTVIKSTDTNDTEKKLTNSEVLYAIPWLTDRISDGIKRKINNIKGEFYRDGVDILFIFLSK